VFFSIAIGAAAISNFSPRSLFSRGFLFQSVFENLNFQKILIGRGAESFTENFVLKMDPAVFQTEEFFTLPGNSHNFFLQTFFENGAVGILFALFTAIFFAKNFARAIQFSAPLLAFYFSVQFSFASLENSIILAGFWALFLREILSFSPITAGLSPQFIKIFFTKISSVILIFLFAGQIFLADIFLKKGIQNYVFESEKSFKNFEIAAKIAPQFAAPRKILVDFFSDENWKKVAPHLKFHEKITGGNFETEILKMKFFAAKNDRENFAKSFAAAENLAPNLPRVFLTAGNFYFKIGDCERAVPAFEKLRKLAPPRAFGENDAARIFKKHAPGFAAAMEKLEVCAHGGSFY